jgi:hypothetical protein
MHTEQSITERIYLKGVSPATVDRSHGGQPGRAKKTNSSKKTFRESQTLRRMGSDGRGPYYNRRARRG